MPARTTSQDSPDDIDLILRHVSRRFPQDLARALIRTGEPIGPATWAETQVTGRQRRLDRALRVKVGKRSRFFHMEWTLRLTRAMGFRVFEYNSLTALAAVDEARAKKKGNGPTPTPWRVDSVVVVLTGRRKPLPEVGFYRTSSSGERFSGVRFRIEPVYQRTVAELEALGSVFWLIFTPLAVDADEAKLARVLEALRGQTTEREPLVHQFERRLGRPLTKDDRARLAKKLRAEGPEKLGDVVLDLSPAELSAWLASSNGHGT